MLETTVDTQGLLCGCLFIVINEIMSDSLEITLVLKAKNSIFHLQRVCNTAGVSAFPRLLAVFILKSL